MTETTQKERDLYKNTEYAGGKSALIARMARDAETLAALESQVQEQIENLERWERSGDVGYRRAGRIAKKMRRALTRRGGEI